MKTISCAGAPFIFAVVGFIPAPAMADYQSAPAPILASGYADTEPHVFKAVPSVGVPAQQDAPIMGRAFAAGKGVFEVRGEFDPDSPGEEWSTLPAMRVVIDADGSRRRVKAGPEHYTAVRWREIRNGWAATTR